MAGYIGSKASVVTPGAERKKVFSITATTTSLTGLVYTPNFVHVYHNGVRLVDGTDYTATNGTSITLTTAAQSGDEVVVISYATFQTSDTVSASAGGTFTGGVTFSDTFTSRGIDDNATSTAMTLDTSGNLLVGKTLLDISQEGVYASSGQVGASKSGIPFLANRLNSDGDIMSFRKDGTTVGSIGTNTGQLYIGYDNAAQDVGILFGNNTITNRSIIPCRSDGTIPDGAIDIGYNSGRWRDLYLSGGVYLGGTGAANLLDDYEEGTWTVQYTDSSGNTSSTTDTGYYTKIGKQVTATFSAANVDTTGLVGTNALFYTLPFTVNAYQAYGSVRLYADVLTGTVSLVAQSSTGSASGTITQSRDNATLQTLDVNQLISGASDFGVTITYFTDA